MGFAAGLRRGLVNNELKKHGWVPTNDSKMLVQAVDYRFSETKPVSESNGMKLYYNKHNDTLQDQRGDWVWVMSDLPS